MHKYLKRILISGTIAAISVTLGLLSLVPTYIGLVSISVSWLATLYYIIRYVFAWYKKDLLKRIEEQDLEQSEESEKEKPSPITSLFE